jgi:hypothetical protein
MLSRISKTMSSTLRTCGKNELNVSAATVRNVGLQEALVSLNQCLMGLES